MRNYLWELKQLGHTYKSIAGALGVSPSTVSRAVKAGGVSSKSASYGAIRNLHRNAITKNLTDQGIHGAFVSANRRMPIEDLMQLPGKIADVATKLKDAWNRPYENYKKDPDAWHIKFPDKKDPPHEFTQKEVEDRVKKALSQKQKLDDSLEPDAEYWNRKKVRHPIIQDEKTIGLRKFREYVKKARK
jgi:hypothetical protein